MWQQTVKQVIHTRRFQVAAASTLSLAIGASGGYLVAKKRLEKHYEELANQEIAEARRYYIQRDQKPNLEDLTKYDDDEEVDLPDPDLSMVEEAVTIMREKGYVAYDKSSEKTESPTDDTQVAEVHDSIKRNVFDTSGEVDDAGGYNLDDEIEKKNAGKPYIVEAEYYLENPDDYSQVTLSYYDEDDTVADDKDQAMPSHVEKKTIGEGNLRFGLGSGQKNVVYICNDELRLLAEVILVEGSFKEIVLGYPTSLKHSAEPKIRKFRNHDD